MVFIVGGLLLIVVGNLLSWSWVNLRWLRILHLAAIAFIVIETWIGVACPLTTLESWLREQTGGEAYPQGFIEYWLSALLFYEAPPWVFVSVYTVFGLLVVAAWQVFPPRTKR